MEAQEEKEAQVAAWLKKIFGDHPIPQYEVNARTTEILHHLSERNRVRDRDVSLVIEDLKQKASEYESEGEINYRILNEITRAKHLQILLMESVNFSPANLSSTGSRYLNALADSAVALEIKDTSLASFIPAVNDLTSDLFRTKSKNEEIKLELAKLEKNLTATLVLEKCLREDLKKAEFHLSTERAKVDNRLQNMDFLKAKSEEFRFGIRTAEEQLSSRGMDASLSHQSLVALSEKLAELKRQTIPLKKKLESYLDLMPNPSLAQVKIEEAKRELDTIEAELTKKVDMMEL
ncbi:HAUS augmin-like complex subunit 1 isoform X1 [Lontra canadensis]|uniref:HAUS augmin-like complex subunit 1 isoform X1 n=1 Tax=Lontra canadensis TaxID=76717 RepID=UPI0013F3362A|nr:HAUS augmin-like complex subunit 1 isoform X1 [Lontra canadensis]XP_032715378.1 HAUS augmin-like complex subunit 1 isoform X1 [Lontra canadensis]